MLSRIASLACALSVGIATDAGCNPDDDDGCMVGHAGSNMLQTRGVPGSMARAALEEEEQVEERTEFSPIRKQGLVCYNGWNFNGGCRVQHVRPFTDESRLRNSRPASWYYNYQPSILPEFGPWMNENNVEFVPMVGWRHVQLNPPGAPRDSRCRTNLKECRCYFTDPALAPADADGRSGPKCRDDDLVNALNRTFSMLKIRPRYLMGYNEPEDTHFRHKNFSPEEAVDYWRRYLEPAADRMGLQLVSPTVNEGMCKQRPYGCAKKATWYSMFLKACYDHRASSPPCSVEKITRISVHYYVCMANEWKSRFAQGGVFWRDLKDQLRNHGDFDWDSYIDSQKLWVTELNCNNDNIGSNAAPGRMVLPTMKEICERISGQAQPQRKWGKRWNWGEGVIHAMESMDTIERWSWWNTWSGGKSTVDEARVLNARLVDDAGVPYPQGLAIMTGAKRSTDCTKGALPPTSKFCVPLCESDPAPWSAKCKRPECVACRTCLHYH